MISLPFTLLRGFRDLTALVTVALTAVALTAPVQAAPAKFEEANQLYDQGKFADAKQRYEQLAAAGEQTANLYFNLGNADYRLGTRGRAILDYERALALQPTHPEAAANLQFAREQSGARMLPEREWTRAVLPWSTTTYTLLAAGAFWVLVFGVVAMRLRPPEDSLLPWVGLAAALVIGAYSAFALWADFDQQSLAVVTATEAVARLAPADRAAVAGKLPAGSEVRVLSEHGAWLYCELPGDQRGWLPVAEAERVHAVHS